MTGYELSRRFFDWCFENPEKISPNHSAIYFFAIEHCNRLGWKNKFGFPTQMAMDAIGIKKHETYIRYFNDLCDWNFFKLVEKSKNQYSSNIISLTTALPKNGEALGKATRTHAGKQTQPIGESTGESNSSIDKPITIKPNNLKPNNELSPEFQFLKIFNECKERIRGSLKRPHEMLTLVDQKNLKKILDGKNSWQDIQYAIEAMLCSDYPKEKGLDNPQHLLRNENFLKYLHIENLNQVKNGNTKSTRIGDYERGLADLTAGKNLSDNEGF